jgi:hypothetical protein
VKMAGEALVVVGIDVGMLVDIIIMLLLLGLIIIVLLMPMPVLVVEPSLAAAAWYASSVLFELATSLMTMDMPFWQWPV